jgi:hypothetical protein
MISLFHYFPPLDNLAAIGSGITAICQKLRGYDKQKNTAAQICTPTEHFLAVKKKRNAAACLSSVSWLY